MKTLLTLCLLVVVSPLYAVDKSTYSFNSGMNSNDVYRLPDTGQTISYAPGDDAAYQPVQAQMSYTVNADNTVKDNRTGLVWRRCMQGRNDDATCSGLSTTENWESALASCQNETADGGGWRLPNAKELLSLLKLVGAAPYIDAGVFPNASYCWTSTTIPAHTDQAQYVNFALGHMSGYIKTSSIYVRCVRGGL